MTFERLVDRGAVPLSELDVIDLGWRQTVRRALRLVTRGGRRANILLPRGHRPLRDGDVLTTAAPAEPRFVTISVRPSPLLRMRPFTLEQMGRLCAELGNAHAPIELVGDVVLTLDDGPTREIAARLEITAEPIVSPFHPERFSVASILDRTAADRVHPQ